MTGYAAAQAEPRPLPPPEPASGECCHGGCDPCVYDLYYEALDRYERALAAWEARRAGASGSRADA